MENRIPIDELFHDKLSQGKEQINLGAWANMERMLDGKNPYASEEEKKKRGLIPFFFLFLLGAGLAGAGFYYKSSIENKSRANTELSQQILDQSSSRNSNVVLDKSDDQLSNQTTVDPTTSQVTASNTQAVIPHNSTTKSVNDLHNNKSHSSIQPKETQLASKHQATSATSPNVNNSVTSSKHAMSSDVSDLNPMQGSATHTATTSNQQVKHYAGQKKVKKSNALASQSKDSHSATSPMLDDHKTNDISSDINDNKMIENIPVVSINQKPIRKGDGTIKGVINDTMGTSMYEKVTDQPSNDRVTASLDPMVTNPRYKSLNEEEERNASVRKQENQESQQVNSSSVVTAEASAVKSSEISIRTAQKSKTTKQTGYFEDLRKFFIDTYTKINNFMVYTPKPDVYTGLNMGLNASLSSSMNNFGGFQGGFTMLKPVSDYFSILSELKFFYRINGGYTVNDISYTISNQNKDTQSVIHKAIYSYDKDSTVKTYNIKNFYSLELPIMFQLNSRSFAFYGGINLAYNFKLQTTDKTRLYHPHHEDTLLMSSAIQYDYPADKGSVIQRDDFSSRFGIGYTIGASYNFSPLLYVDLRIAQNVWDNKKTNAAREISNGFFKVPSIQFALGYRFRKFTPGN